MDLIECQNKFEELVSNISADHLSPFLRWIQTNYLTSDCLGDKPAIAYQTLNRIGNDLKLMVSPNELGVVSSEVIHYPSNGQNSDCNAINTLIVDSFIYDELDLQDLEDEGRLDRNYCLDCNSRNIKPLNFISHSASKKQISFIFTGFLKSVNFCDKTILDIGSRLGALLYGAYVYTNAKQIIGVEMNEELCAIQKTIIEKYQMNDRIKVICSDVCSLAEVVNSSDVILLNNVFEFFQNRSKVMECWQFLHRYCKSGAILVTIPSLEDSLKSLPQCSIDLSKWVLRQEIRDPLLAMSIDDPDEELTDICVYHVL